MYIPHMYRVSFHPEQCALSVFFLSCFASLFIAFPAFLCLSTAFPGSRPRESYFSYSSIIVHSSVSLGNILLISLCAFICLFLSRFFSIPCIEKPLAVPEHLDCEAYAQNGYGLFCMHVLLQSANRNRAFFACHIQMVRVRACL